jgi:hypothetical protein
MKGHLSCRPHSNAPFVAAADRFYPPLSQVAGQRLTFAEATGNATVSARCKVDRRGLCGSLAHGPPARPNVRGFQFKPLLGSSGKQRKISRIYCVRIGYCVQMPRGFFTPSPSNQESKIVIKNFAAARIGRLGFVPEKQPLISNWRGSQARSNPSRTASSSALCLRSSASFSRTSRAWSRRS